MNCDKDLDSRQLQVKLQAITADIQTLAHSYQGNTRALLAVLRTLEQTHREIRENLFQSSLPDSRQDLYAVLRDIEESGGWPYIDRMRLRSLLSKIPDVPDSLNPEVHTTDTSSND